MFPGRDQMKSTLTGIKIVGSQLHAVVTYRSVERKSVSCDTNDSRRCAVLTCIKTTWVDVVMVRISMGVAVIDDSNFFFADIAAAHREPRVDGNAVQGDRNSTVVHRLRGGLSGCIV